MELMSRIRERPRLRKVLTGALIFLVLFTSHGFLRGATDPEICPDQ